MRCTLPSRFDLSLCRFLPRSHVSQLSDLSLLLSLSTYIREEGLLTVTIPAHPVLKVGTLNAILQVVAKQKNVLKEDLLNSLR